MKLFYSHALRPSLSTLAPCLDWFAELLDSVKAGDADGSLRIGSTDTLRELDIRSKRRLDDSVGSTLCDFFGSGTAVIAVLWLGCQCARDLPDATRVSRSTHALQGVPVLTVMRHFCGCAGIGRSEERPSAI